MMTHGSSHGFPLQHIAKNKMLMENNGIKEERINFHFDT